jgi:hypothetical protein
MSASTSNLSEHCSSATRPLPKDYGRPGLDKRRLGELTAASEGEKTHRSVDLLGRVYEYFLTCFAWPMCKNAGSSTRRVVWRTAWSRCSRPCA